MFVVEVEDDCEVGTIPEHALSQAADDAGIPWNIEDEYRCDADDTDVSDKPDLDDSVPPILSLCVT